MFYKGRTDWQRNLRTVKERDGWECQKHVFTFFVKRKDWWWMKDKRRINDGKRKVNGNEKSILVAGGIKKTTKIQDGWWKVGFEIRWLEDDYRWSPVPLREGRILKVTSHLGEQRPEGTNSECHYKENWTHTDKEKSLHICGKISRQSLPPTVTTAASRRADTGGHSSAWPKARSQILHIVTRLLWE